MRKTTREDYQVRIMRVKLHIQQNLDAQMTLEELADVACFSPYHFHRIFKAMVGESVQEHIRRLRLERAAFELTCSERSVLTVALDAGYETHEAFTRAFRRRFDCSPSECRRDGLKQFPAAPSALTSNMGEKKMDVKTEQFEAMTVAAVRHTGPYQECSKAWGILCANPKVCSTFGPATKFLGISHDNPDITEPDKIRYDACVTIEAEQDFGPDIFTQTIPAGRYAVLIHKGSYDGLSDCYQYIYGQWLQANGQDLAPAPPIEIYHNDPKSTPPEELVTEIRVPLK